MLNWVPELPESGWRKVLKHTSVTTLIVAVLAVFGTLIANSIDGRATEAVDYYASVVLAVLFTVPLYGFLAFKLQQMHLLNRKLHDLATTDFLTGALNRGAFVTNVENHLHDSGTRDNALTSALLVIDVDHFKAINDRYGHQTGDMALVRIADTLRGCLKENTMFGRLGGEEFGVFLEGVTPHEAMRIAESCRIAVGKSIFLPAGETHALSISIGVAFVHPGDDFTSLFKQADTCLYLAKSRGRNRIETDLSALAA